MMRDIFFSAILGMVGWLVLHIAVTFAIWVWHKKEAAEIYKRSLLEIESQMQRIQAEIETPAFSATRDEDLSHTLNKKKSELH